MSFSAPVSTILAISLSGISMTSIFSCSLSTPPPALTPYVFRFYDWERRTHEPASGSQSLK